MQPSDWSSVSGTNNAICYHRPSFCWMKIQLCLLMNKYAGHKWWLTLPTSLTSEWEVKIQEQFWKMDNYPCLNRANCTGVSQLFLYIIILFNSKSRGVHSPGLPGTRSPSSFVLNDFNSSTCDLNPRLIQPRLLMERHMVNTAYSLLLYDQRKSVTFWPTFLLWLD